MNPNVSLVTEVAVTVGACRPMGISGRLRLEASPHHSGINEETGLMDRR